MKLLPLVSCFLGACSLLGQTPKSIFQSDLQNYGWKADRGVLHGSWLSNSIDFSDDDSLWVAFPTEASNALQTRDTPSEYRGKVLHIEPDGRVAAVCDLAAQQWGYLRLFAQRSDGYSLETPDKLSAYDTRCKQRSTYPTDGRTQVSPSPNRAIIYTRTRDNHVRVLNAENLAVMKELDLPESVHRDQVLFGDRLIVCPATIQTRSCWQTQFSRLDIATVESHPWVTIDCARYGLLGDDHIVYSNTGGDAPLKITEGPDDPGVAYNPPHNTHIDLAVLDGSTVGPPDSLRIVEELIETRGRHPSLDMSGKFVGRDIVLLDMRTGTSLLTVKVPMDSLTYAYSLSRDGKKLAVLLNSHLTVYQVP
jgi:hypothetical protein